MTSFRLFHWHIRLVKRDDHVLCHRNIRKTQAVREDASKPKRAPNTPKAERVKTVTAV